MRRPPIWRAPLRAVTKNDATAAVEFAFIAPVVLALMLGTVQIAVIYLAQTELETAIEAAERLVLTNQAQSMTSAAFRSAVCVNLPALFQCNNIMIDLVANSGASTSCLDIKVTPPILTYNPDGTINNTWSYQPGSPGQVEILRVMYQWPVIAGPFGIFVPNVSKGTLFMAATAVFQNENQ